MIEKSISVDFCPESYKAHRNPSGKEVIDLFLKYGVFDYIREFYDVLHTTGHQYINNDIDIYLRSRGMVLNYYAVKVKTWLSGLDLLFAIRR